MAKLAVGTGTGGYIMAQMTLERAIQLLQREYEKAQKLDFVFNPIAFALYKVWKMADDRGGER